MGKRQACRAVLLLILLPPVAGGAQDVPISGVESRVVHKTSGVLRVILENTSDTPLTAIEFQLSQPDASRGIRTTGHNLEAEPLKMGTRRTLDLDLRSSPDVTAAAVRKVTFADGSTFDGANAAQRVRLVSSERLARETYSLAVVNRRNVPIEAIGLMRLAPDSTRVSGGHRTDYALGDPSTPPPRNGRIAPGEEREFDVDVPAQAESVAPPVVRVSFVLFDDLAFEGSAAERDELFRAREKTAASFTAAIAAVREAAAMPEADAVRFLKARQAEWSSSRQYEAHLLGDVLGSTPSGTAPFSVRATGIADVWEQQLARLLRHQKQKAP